MSQNQAPRAQMEDKMTAAECERTLSCIKQEDNRTAVQLQTQTSPASRPEPSLIQAVKTEIKEEPEELIIKQVESVKQEEEQLPVCVQSSAVRVKTEDSSLLQQPEETKENINIIPVAISPIALRLGTSSDGVATAQILNPTQTNPAQTNTPQSPAEEPVLRENSVSSILRTPFARRSLEEQKRVIDLGPDQPDLCLQQRTGDRGRTFVRAFSRNVYEKRRWLMGCDVRNAFFCFPCLLFNCTETETAWTSTGIRELRYLSEKWKRHENSCSHIDSCFRISVFGRTNLAAQVDEVYRAGIRNHNKEVTKNRHILSQMIDRIKFCGAFDLDARGQDESESSNIPGIFHNLVDSVSSPDSVLKAQLDGSPVFNGMSKTFQNELLDCMLSVTRDEILRQIKDTDFVSIQVSELRDRSNESHLVLLLRYVDKTHLVQERFYSFIPLQSATAESMAVALEEQLAAVLPDHKDKLISQSYDGIHVLGVHGRIQKQYPNAHYIHCYAHQLHSITRQATAYIPKVHAFFNDLDRFELFFATSPKCTSVLTETLVHGSHTSDHIQWNFPAVNTVFENMERLILCFEKIRESGDFDVNTKREAEAMLRLMESPDFKFFLELFHQILPLVDVLFTNLQKKDIDCYHAEFSIQQFQEDIQNIRDVDHFIAEEEVSGAQPKKRPRLADPEDSGSAAEEIQEQKTIKYQRQLEKSYRIKICDTILKHTTQRFSFTSHLIASTLLQTDRFEEYHRSLSEKALSSLKVYPTINATRLKTELGVIYSKQELRVCRGAMDLLHIFANNNFLDIFPETVQLLKMVITMPMPTAEAERCCSTLKRVKTFLTNPTNQDRLDALAMLSVENQLITHMWDFNHRVIEKFAAQKDRSEKFLYK